MYDFWIWENNNFNIYNDQNIQKKQKQMLIVSIRNLV